MANENTSIYNILIDGIVDRLTETLIGDTFDETEIGLIRFGKLQADPTDADRGLNILVHTGGDEFPDELYSSSNADGVEAVTYEVGGGEFWWRRFLIETVLFFDNEDDRQIARNKGVIIISHCQKSLATIETPTEKDSFKESALGARVKKVSQNEGGGEGTFIWRGKIYMEFLTYIAF